MNDIDKISPKEKTKEILLLKKTKPLKDLLKIYKIQKSLFYYHAKRMLVDKYAREKLLIEYLFNKSEGRYGYRRIKIALETQFKCKLAFKTIRKLMKEMNIKCYVKSEKTNYACKFPDKIVNLINRDFYTSEPDTKWVTDVTEFRIAKQKIYLSIIKDLFNMEIVAYSISRNNDWRLILDTLDKCSNRENVEHVILHSDQGIIYQSKNYVSYLRKRNYIQSMSRKGNCYDNAPAESFFGTLKSETIYLKHIHNINELVKTIDDYIKWYNEDRISLKLNGLSPIEYKNKYLN